MTDPSYFDQRAKTWDQNPKRIKMANAVAGGLKRTVAVNSAMTVIDFGCGSGLMTLQLANQVKSVVAMDTSQGMLDVLTTNLKEAGIDNVTTRYLSRDGVPPAVEPVDLIVSNMVFHHIPDIPATLKRLESWLNPGGWLAISDLEPEDGRFHGPEAGEVHHGLDPQELKITLQKLGLTVKSLNRVYEMDRPAPDGSISTYPIFLLVAKK